MFVFVYIRACVPDDNRGLKRILDSMELKLQMVVSHHLHSGNWTLSHSWPLPHFSLTICFRLYLWLVDRPMTSVFLNPNQDWQENVSSVRIFQRRGIMQQTSNENLWEVSRPLRCWGQLECRCQLRWSTFYSSFTQNIRKLQWGHLI